MSELKHENDTLETEEEMSAHQKDLSFKPLEDVIDSDVEYEDRVQYEAEESDEPDEPDDQDEQQDLEKKPAFSPFRMIIAILIIIIAICGFVLVNKRIDKRNASRCEPVTSKKHITGVDSMEITGKTLKITGYCIKKGIDTKKTKENAQVKVILMNMADNNDKIFMDSSITEDETLNERFPLQSIDYAYGGFEAEIKVSKLDLDSKNYEILVSKMDYPWESSRFCLTGIRTGYYIKNGKLEDSK